jgi:hypothetical protein
LFFSAESKFAKKWRPDFSGNESREKMAANFVCFKIQNSSQIDTATDPLPFMSELKQLLEQADAILQARTEAIFQITDELSFDASEEEIAHHISSQCEHVIRAFPLTPAQQQAVQQRAIGDLQ